MYKNFKITEQEKQYIMEMYQINKKTLTEEEITSEPTQETDGEFIKKFMNYFGFNKVHEKQLEDGGTLEGYEYSEGPYKLMSPVVKKGEKYYGKVSYVGPSFENPENKTHDEYTKHWINIKQGSDEFPDILGNAMKKLKSIKKYHNAPSLSR